MRFKTCSGWVLLWLLAAGLGYGESGEEPLVVVQNGKYGYIDHKGKIIIAPQFIWGDDFWRGLGTVYVCGRYLSIDRSGKLHPRRIAVDDKLEPESADDKYGFVDASGRFRIAPVFDQVLPFSEGLAAVRSGEKWGFIDASGRMEIPQQFIAAYYFHDGVAIAQIGSRDLLIDRSGKILAKDFDSRGSIAEGRVPAIRAYKTGYLDTKGRVAVPFVYDAESAFSEGRAAVKMGEKWGYIDRNGKLLIPFKFDEASSFASGLAPATLGEKTGFIHPSGSFAFFLAYRFTSGFLTGDKESNLLIAPSDVARFWTTDNRFGYVNRAGRVIWGPTKEQPDHPPILGWSEEDKTASCAGIPESIRSEIAGFPKQ
jgi:hypothetical protein